jgi:SAM-dependent methyltransferase
LLFISGGAGHHGLVRSHSTSAVRYDLIGRGYAPHRRAEPRWEQAVAAALDGACTVVNVGAGTGSYEPSNMRVAAVEPSAVMVAQRPAGAAPAVRAVAGALPFASRSFDAALAVLTVHHWADPQAGLAELRRVAARQVVMTWDPQVMESRFWFARDYLPEAAERERGLSTIECVTAALGPTVRTEALPVPADCTDGVFGAYWNRPHAYLDPAVRAAISAVALLPPGPVHRAAAQLETDLANGTWQRLYGDLLDLPELDLGYRLVIAG